MSKYVKKLGSDKTYQRPQVTYQEQLTYEEVQEKLQGYKRVDNIAEVPIDTHVRYFAKDKNGEQAFRLGGLLIDKRNADTYVRLRNANSTWSVQVDGTIFFARLSHKEEIESLHESYTKKLDEKDATIAKLKDYIKSHLPDEDITAITNSKKAKSLSKSNKPLSKSNKTSTTKSKTPVKEKTAGSKTNKTKKSSKSSNKKK